MSRRRASLVDSSHTFHPVQHLDRHLRTNMPSHGSGSRGVDIRVQGKEQRKKRRREKVTQWDCVRHQTMPAKIKDKGLIPRQHKCGLLGLTWGTDVKCPRCEHINDGDDQCPLCNTYT